MSVLRGEGDASESCVIPCAAMNGARGCFGLVHGMGFSRKVADTVRHNKGLWIFKRKNADIHKIRRESEKAITIRGLTYGDTKSIHSNPNLLLLGPQQRKVVG